MGDGSVAEFVRAEEDATDNVRSRSGAGRSDWCMTVVCVQVRGASSGLADARGGAAWQEFPDI